MISKKTKIILTNKILKKNLKFFFTTNELNKKLTLQIKKYLKELETNGSIIIRDFPITENYIADFKKFSSLFGILHKQNKTGEQIVRIEDYGNRWTAKNRGYKTKEKLDLHTDGGKLSLLFCIRNSKIGGESTKLNAATIYEIIKDNKTLIKKLRIGFKYHTRNEAKSLSIITKKKYPIFFFNNKKLHCMYNSKPIVEALKCIKNNKDSQIIAEFNKIILSLEKKCEVFKIKRGDIWIVNNYKVLHGRKKFKNLNQQRLLLRAWVSPKKFAYKGKTILDAYNDR